MCPFRRPDLPRRRTCGESPAGSTRLRRGNPRFCFGEGFRFDEQLRLERARAETPPRAQDAQLLYIAIGRYRLRGHAYAPDLASIRTRPSLRPARRHRAVSYRSKIGGIGMTT